MAYPKPQERGLNHVTAPGYVARPQQPTPTRAEKENFQLTLETANTTGWTGA